MSRWETKRVARVKRAGKTKIILGADNTFIAAIDEGSTDDAQLCAAAPELLEALELSIAACDGIKDDAFMPHTAMILSNLHLKVGLPFPHHLNGGEFVIQKQNHDFQNLFHLK